LLNQVVSLILALHGLIAQISFHLNFRLIVLNE